MSIHLIVNKQRVHFRSKVNGKNRSVIVNKSDAEALYHNIKTKHAMHNFRANVDECIQSIYDTFHEFVKSSPYYSISNPNARQYYYVRKN